MSIPLFSPFIPIFLDLLQLISDGHAQRPFLPFPFITIIHERDAGSPPLAFGFSFLSAVVKASPLFFFFFFSQDVE